ncbi:MAG: efflux RND transporter periplasmic adaptor subunit [Alphaproteobacteria bacterium]|nr:efflux RND transporter periplasmic adaptor subunit [Alphaproteobacteria bacterium]
MIKRMIIMIVGVVLIVGGILGFKFMMASGTKKFLSTMGAPPQTVSTMEAASTDWQQALDAVGTVRAVNGADLSAEVAGIVQTLSFDSGADVDKDSVLVQLRGDDDIAKLQALQAQAKLAQVTLDRDQKQLKAQAVSQATVDNDIATLNSAKAQVDAQQALNDKKTIRAPFAGHLGIRQVDVGQYLNPGSTIVSLQQLDPIYIDFNMPEQALAQVAEGQKVAAHIDALPNTSFDGEVTAVNSRVDEATRNVQVRASFKNPDHKLLPGMFAHVNITVGEPQKFVTLPQTAITYNPYGNTVYLVTGPDDKPVAQQTFVTTGQQRGDQVAILTGVKEGDTVITSGQLKLRNGSPLIINNEIQPKNDANPKPVDK